MESNFLYEKRSRSIMEMSLTLYQYDEWMGCCGFVIIDNASYNRKIWLSRWYHQTHERSTLVQISTVYKIHMQHKNMTAWKRKDNHLMNLVYLVMQVGVMNKSSDFKQLWDYM